MRDSKTGPRDVIIGAPVRRFLRAQKVRGKRWRSALNPERVFPMIEEGEYEAVRSVWTSVRREADLPPKLRIHDLRHSFASHAVMSGETLLTTSRLLGHRRIKTTARYAHLADDALLAAAEKVGAILMKQVAGEATPRR
nr:tyrosine-type recombinase/integrase [Sphingobium lactosutens]